MITALIKITENLHQVINSINLEIYSALFFFVLIKYWLFLYFHVTTHSWRRFKIHTQVAVLRGRVDKQKEMVNKSSFLNKTIDVKLDDKNISLYEMRPLETLSVLTYYFDQEGLVNWSNMVLVKTNSWASTLPAGM